MAFTKEQIAAIESSMADFLTKRRPPEHLRDKIDLAWRIDGQSVLIHAIRPCWSDEDKKIEQPVAKATFVRTTNRWKIHWMRSDLKWHVYPNHPEAVFFDEFLAVVDEDENGCFWG